MWEYNLSRNYEFKMKLSTSTYSNLLSKGLLVSALIFLMGRFCFAQNSSEQFLTPAKNSLNNQELNAYANRAMQKVKDFTNYLELITNKKYDRQVRAHSLKPALKLFSSSSNFMEIASTSSRLIKKYPINSYLRKIQKSSYQRIKISHDNMRWLEPLHRQNNGSYFGTIVCDQRFSGVYQDGREYSDFTTKAYNIVLKKENKGFGSRNLKVWQLYLGDVKIESITTNDHSLQIQVEKTVNEGIISGISFNSIQQFLKSKQADLSTNLSANKYLEHSNQLASEWSNKVRAQTSASAQLTHVLKVSRYGNEAQNVKLTLQLKHNPFGLGNAKALQYDQSKSYYNIFIKDYLSAFAILVDQYIELNPSATATSKATGHASVTQNMSLSTYNGELGRVEDVVFFSENSGKFESITLSDNQKINTEQLAFLRSLMGSKSVQVSVKEPSELKINLNQTEEDFSRVLTLEVLISDAYSTLWESLSDSDKNEVINARNP